MRYRTPFVLIKKEKDKSLVSSVDRQGIEKYGN